MGSRLCPLPTAAAPPCSGQRSSLGADELQASRRVCCHHSIRMQCHTLHASTTLQLLSIDIDIDRRPMLGNLNYSPLFRVPDLLIPGRRQHLSTQVIMPMMPTTRKMQPPTSPCSSAGVATLIESRCCRPWFMALALLPANLPAQKLDAWSQCAVPSILATGCSAR